jgi:hypothetical protein
MTDPRIKRACPFCDEAVHLRVHSESCPLPMVEGTDTVKGEDGFDLENYVDGVSCEVCGALVPLIVWNGEISAEEYAIRRAFEPTEAGGCGCGHDRHPQSAMQAAA